MTTEPQIELDLADSLVRLSVLTEVGTILDEACQSLAALLDCLSTKEEGSFIKAEEAIGLLAVSSSSLFRALLRVRALLSGIELELARLTQGHDGKP